LPSIAALTIIAPAAGAYEAGDWIVRVGAGTVDPKSNIGTVVSVDSGSSLVFNGIDILSSKLGLEVLAALPFSHDIKLAAGGVKVGETKHLPPTLSLQYHFTNDSAFTPYAGAGLNYTLFFDEEATGGEGAAVMRLGPSVPLVAGNPLQDQTGTTSTQPTVDNP